MNKVNNKIPRYIKIAIDIAQRIDNLEFKEGAKLRGRSTLASEYNVSPETIRRSASLLEDMDVVTVTQKSGIFVKSTEKARIFIEKFSEKSNLNATRQKLKELRQEKLNIEKKIDVIIDSITESSLQLKRINLGSSFELSVPPESQIHNKTISELQFWYNTGATITAVKRDYELFISPGPYFAFKEGDVMYFICTEENYYKVEKFIKSSEI